jgi:hypothetical protein
MYGRIVRSLSIYFILALFCLPFLPYPVNANLVIKATYDQSITDMSDSADIMTVINNTLDIYDTMYTNKATISLDFTSMDTGLAESTNTIYSLPYTTYLTALTKDKQGDDTSFLQFIQPTPQNGNPVNGNAAIKLTSANLTAIGVAGAAPGAPSGGVNYDSVISLNFSELNITRVNPDDYKDDLETVVEHEVDEALGMNSGLNGAGNNIVGMPGGPVAPMDLYRYDINGNRSYTTNPGTQAYFSVDGGKTDLEQFNQTPGLDYQDWKSSNQAYVQDAASTLGADPDLALPELKALDVLGYNTAAPAPETPTSTAFGLMLVGAMMIMLYKNSAKRAPLLDEVAVNTSFRPHEGSQP